MKRRNKTVVILSVSSDIGYYLAKRYLENGYNVVGTYRRSGHISELKKFSNCHLFQLDVMERGSKKSFLQNFRKLEISWDIFISCIGELRPVSRFFQADFGLWRKSLEINAIEPLGILHELYKYKTKKNKGTIVFFAGGGVNNAVVDMSSYTVSKILLVKMCELLDSENKDLSVFIVGPGWRRTKIHKAVADKSQMSLTAYWRSIAQLRSRRATDMEDIFRGIEWLSSSGKDAVSGRNFSLRNDPIGNKRGAKLISQLKKDKNMFTLRRSRNEYSLNEQKESTNS